MYNNEIMAVSPRKKVLFLITKSNWGGAQRYVYDLATNLDRSKFEPVVALGGSGALSTMLENAHIKVVYLGKMKNTTGLAQARMMLAELQRVIKSEKPDIFHLNSSVAGLMGAIAGRLSRVPTLIFTAHGWAFNEDRPYQQRLIIKALHWLTIMLCDRTIAVSTALVSQMNWPFAHRKMKVINPGRTIGAMYDKPEAREKIIDFCPPLSSAVNDYWLLCLAELHPIKRHHILISAFAVQLKIHPTNRLLLIGEGEERLKIERQIADLSLNNHVFLLGNIVEAARFLKAFDGFVLVSKSESYGYVLHEAGLAGVPIIATNVGGIPDIIKNGEDGLLMRPDNVPILIKAMEEIQTNPKRAQTRATNLRQKLTTRTVAKMTRQTESLYSL